MKIRIEDIPEQGLDIALNGKEDLLSDSIAKIPADKRIEIHTSPSGHLHVAYCDREIVLSGTVETTFSLQCSRCLVRFGLPVTVDPYVVIRRRDLDSTGEKEGITDDEVCAFFIEGEEIDLGDILVQELLLELPMKPLCNEDCPGLCAKCGAAKGSPACTCEIVDAVDPRWEVLAKLKDGMNP